MKKYKNKFIAAIAVLALLMGAWFWGGAPRVNHPTPEPDVSPVAMAQQPAETPIHTETPNPDENYRTIEVEVMPYAPTEEHEGHEEYYKPEPQEEPYEPCKPIGQYEPQEAEDIQIKDEGLAFDIVPDIANSEHFETTPEGVVVPDIDPANIQILATSHPEMRAPTEPEDMVIGDGYFTVVLSVRVHTILYNMHLLHRDKHELVPDDGWIFPPTEVVVYEGESVFNVLQREMRRHRIHMVARWTPIFNSAYVEAINNLYEFDVGPLSGWMYSVNGWFPNFGASRYLLSPGDVIEWVYTVDLGRDLGVLWLGGENDE